MTSVQLFHNDSSVHLGFEDLRKAARMEVRTSPLIRRAHGGELLAAHALHKGFWHFVFEFENAIDKKNLHAFRKPLQEKFGAKRVAGMYRAIAAAVREMKEEEGSHAKHWHKDAQCLGLPALENHGITGVLNLVRAAFTDDLTHFFSVLAGTEFIAEELSRFLNGSRDYTNLFTRKRWMWGEVHLAPHEHGPSHLEIDLDLARAYSKDDNHHGIRHKVLDTIHLFGEAASDVEAALAPRQLAAAS